MFIRRGGPLISVLIPTRKRSRLLYKCLYSLCSLAADKNSLEFIVKADGDDEETILNLAKACSTLPIKTIISDRGKGYQDLNVWLNEMASIAKGDWLVAYNDDTEMQTPGWDQILLNYRIEARYHGVSEVCLLFATMEKSLVENSYQFSFVRRKVFEILGHLSPNTYVDQYLYTLMNFIHSAFRIPIQIAHLADKANDETNRGALIAHRIIGSSSNFIESVQNSRAKHKDAGKLLNYIEAEIEKRKT